MKNIKISKETKLKDVRNLFRLNKLKKETNDATINGIIFFFLDYKKKKAIKGRIIRDIRILFEHKEEENYYKPVRIGNFWSKDYVEYKSNSDRNKTLSVEEYLNKIKLYLKYLKDIINDLKKSDTWKIQLTITIIFISSEDDNDEECVIHSKRDNIVIMINDEVDEIIEKRLKSVQYRY